MATTTEIESRHAAPTGPSRRRERRSKRLLLRGALLATPLIILVVWTAIPFLVTLSVSLKTRGGVFADFGLIPDTITFQAYQDVISDPIFYRAFMNSVIVGAGTSILTALFSVPAAYAFVRFAFRGRHLLLLFVLLPRLVPDVGTMVPLFRMASAAGLIDNPLSLIIAYSGMLIPLAVWLLVGFFRQIPSEIEDASSVDGASLYQRIRYIMLPLASPAIITVIVLAFREAWNEFTLVLVLTSSPEGRTLPYALYLLGHGAIDNYPASAAFALLTVIPFVLIYTRVERFVVAGLTSGSSK